MCEEFGREKGVSARGFFEEQYQGIRKKVFGEVSCINMLLQRQSRVFFILNSLKGYAFRKVQATNRIANMESAMSSLLGQ